MRETSQGQYVIVGGGVSGLLAGWRRRREGDDVVVLEAGERPGGVVATVSEEGFLIERAASSLRAGASAILGVIGELGLEPELVESAPAARRRWILRDGELVAVPASPLGFVRTGLLSARAKLRLLKEPWIGRGDGGDPAETLADFIARRFGAALVDPLLDAVVTGIFAGDPRRLEARAAFPRLVEMEERHGSVLRGFLKEARAVKRSAPTAPSAPTARHRRGFLALRGGMQQLVDRLASALGESVRCNARVERISRIDPTGPGTGAGWRVELADATSLETRDLLLATPSWASARLLAPVDRELAVELAALEHANVAVVAIGVRREQIGGDVDGLGFLVPSSEHTPLLGILYESSVFPERAPAGHVLLRAMVGGERTQLPAEPLAAGKLAWLEASRILKITGAPRLLRTFLHRPGIPQYRPGHTARMQRIDARLKALPGLRLAGWSYRGIALDDRARESLAS